MPCLESERLPKAYVEKMFRKIDTNNRGWISKDDIKDTLLQMGIPTSSQVCHASNVFQFMGKDEDTHVTLTDFVGFVRAREDELYDIFKTVKPDINGRITSAELAKALLQKLEIAKDMQEALYFSSEFIFETDKHNVSFHEFIHALLFMPNVDARQLFDHWARASRIDLGEDYLVPAEPTLEKSRLNIFISGALAGCVSRTVTAPLDRLKVIMQAGKGDGIMNGLIFMYREGGPLGLWRGNLTNCIKIGPESAAKFLCYGEFKQVVTGLTGGDARHPSSTEKFLAGAAAGVVAQTLIYPLEIVKTRLALSVTGEFNGLCHAFVTILREGGVRGMFRGLVPSLLGIIPYSGIDLMVFNTLKENWIARNRRLLSSWEPDVTPGVLTLLLFGATSSTCGQVVAYPLQLVRTRLQADKVGIHRRYAGMSDCFIKIFRQYGVLGFYRGIGPNFLKSVPSISISYAVFETVSTAIQRGR